MAFFNSLHRTDLNTKFIWRSLHVLCPVGNLKTAKRNNKELIMLAANQMNDQRLKTDMFLYRTKVLITDPPALKKKKTPYIWPFYLIWICKNEYSNDLEDLEAGDVEQLRWSVASCTWSPASCWCAPRATRTCARTAPWTAPAPQTAPVIANVQKGYH